MNALDAPTNKNSNLVSDPLTSGRPTHSPWQGRLSLEFQRRNRLPQPTHQTILSRVQVQAPLKVQRPFYPESEVCHCVMLHTAGGIVGGDRLIVAAQLQPNAQALLTTAAAAKVYRSNGPESIQTISLKVATGAQLEWLPQEAILFNGACYRQQLTVELDPGAAWFGWELTRLGRSARGETFMTGEWRSRIEVWQEGRLVWVDPQWVMGGGAMLNSQSGLAGAVVIGSFALIQPTDGPEISPALVEQARQIVAAPQFRITRLQTGLLCRYRGASTIEAKRGFIALWSLLRQTCWGRAACLPRVWQ
jgi:urease accessory protein